MVNKILRSHVNFFFLQVVSSKSTFNSICKQLNKISLLWCNLQLWRNKKQHYTFSSSNLQALQDEVPILLPPFLQVDVDVVGKHVT